jgi:hypothetical protein
MKQTINEILEAQVLQIVNTDGQYVALKRCVLCRPLKAAAHRLVLQKSARAGRRVRWEAGVGKSR